MANSQRKISAAEFLSAYLEEWTLLLTRVSDPELAQAFGRNAEWTAWMLGETRRGESPPYAAQLGEKGFLGKVAERLGFLNGPEESQVRREDYTVDCSFVSGSPMLTKSRSKWGYASFLSVLIEHENDLDSIQYEMWKLLFWRSPLKVIISYDSPIESRKIKDQRRLIDKLNDLRRMLDEVDAGYSKPDDAEYLILIGERDNCNSRPHWFWTVDFSTVQSLA